MTQKLQRQNAERQAREARKQLALAISNLSDLPANEEQLDDLALAYQLTTKTVRVLHFERKGRNEK